MIFLLSFGLQESHKLSHAQYSLPIKSVNAKGELAFDSQEQCGTSEEICQVCYAIKKLTTTTLTIQAEQQLTTQIFDYSITYTNNYLFSICQTQRNKAPPVC